MQARINVAGALASRCLQFGSFFGLCLVVCMRPVSPFRVTTGRVRAANAWNLSAAISWEGQPPLSGVAASNPAAACVINASSCQVTSGLNIRTLP